MLTTLMEASAASPFFLQAPRRFLQKRVQLVVPSLPALLAQAASDGPGHQLPLPGTKLGDFFDEYAVLFLVPVPLDCFWSHLSLLFSFRDHD